jgi:PKD repeat protein
MKRLLIILPILSLVLAGCYREPYADAYITPSLAFVGEDIHFTNASVNTDYVEWDMGDGTTSSAYNVNHFYYDPGSYYVNLRAFGHSNGVSVASFVVDVIGSEIEIVVKEFFDEYYVEGASVVLYATYDDWLNFENPVGEEQFSNQYGECYFSNLSYHKYYVDVWEASHDNWYLGEDNPEQWIETQQLPGGWDHTFIAYVNYYEPTAKKSASLTRPATRELRAPMKSSIDNLPLKENKFSIKKEKK